jgi:outer membrane protein assembly factor BamB
MIPPRCLLIASASLLLAGVSAGAGDAPPWARFRGADGLGVAQGKAALPVHFGPDKNVLWKADLPEGLSSPCIAGKRIFLTGFNKDTKKLETLCIDRDKGTILWRKAAPAERIERVEKTSSPAAGTPACDSERVYVYFGSYGLLCYDLEGKELWKMPIPVPKTRFGTGTSPVVAGDLVLLKCQGEPAQLLAVDARTGRVRWKKDKLPYDPGPSLPLVRKAGKGHEVIVHGERGIKGYDLADGKERWSMGGLMGAAIPTPIQAEGLFYFVSDYPGGDRDDRWVLPSFDDMLKKYDKNKDGKLDYDEVKDMVLYSRDSTEKAGDITMSVVFGILDRNNDGKLDRFEWTFVRLLSGLLNNALLAITLEDGDKVQAKVAWRDGNSLPEVATPVCYQGRLYLAKHGGILSCLNAKTGKLLFRGRLKAPGLYYTSPVAGDGKVYLASSRGVVIVLKASDKLEVLARNDLGETIGATPAIVDGVLYVRAGKHLYAFKEASGGR